MTVKGIDVASYQSATYDSDGLAFVVVKATESTGYVNPLHAAQVAHGRAEGLVVGHYHFVRPGSISAQAAYFLRQAAAKAGDFLVLDWEDAAVSNTDKDTWIKDVQKLSPVHQVLLYGNRDFWLNRDTTSFCGDGLWIADPDAAAGHPKVEHAWTFHQYSSAGGVDHDLGNFASKAALETWAAKGVTPAKPNPKPTYEPFPGASWFKVGRTSPVVTAMHERLVAVGCSRYRSHTNLNVIGSGDIASYEAWQRACGHSGKAATWPPGKSTWDRLKVPNV
jgi:Glycosyl hydrolases family 25